MLAFPVWSLSRLPPERPDNALNWSGAATATDPHAGQRGLARVLETHVAWDSEYYLSIARHGYDDPGMRAVDPDAGPHPPGLALKGEQPGWYSLNHAFFPLYPWLMRAVGMGLAPLALPAQLVAILSGVAVSMLGTLGAMLALYDLARGPAHIRPPEVAPPAGGPADGDGLRAAFYLLVWPASVFLAQVYTEGLFLGLSFGALALMRRRRWAWAAALGAAAVWTRSAGLLLVVPFGLTWLADGGLAALRREPRKALLTGALAAAPLLAYLAWRATYGAEFLYVQTHYFGRDAFAVERSGERLLRAWHKLWGRNGPQVSAYQMVEFAGIFCGIAFSLLLARRNPILAVYGLLVMVFCMTSGAALGAHRYVLGVPALFLVPAQWGRSIAFDRLWTLAGAMTMAVFTLAFSAGFWAG